MVDKHSQSKFTINEIILLENQFLEDSQYEAVNKNGLYRLIDFNAWLPGTGTI